MWRRRPSPGGQGASKFWARSQTLFGGAENFEGSKAKQTAIWTFLRKPCGRRGEGAASRPRKGPAVCLPSSSLLVAPGVYLIPEALLPGACLSH